MTDYVETASRSNSTNAHWHDSASPRRDKLADPDHSERDVSRTTVTQPRGRSAQLGHPVNALACR
ncbi:MAG TPA: hypothetical protein VGL80_10760 [Pseudonocardiaceae bacterium]|jgi:hypothetical protein